jgi:hypothetical protein
MLLLQPAPIHYSSSFVIISSAIVASRRRLRGCFLITRWLDDPLLKFAAVLLCNVLLNISAVLLLLSSERHSQTVATLCAPHSSKFK